MLIIETTNYYDVHKNFSNNCTLRMYVKKRMIKKMYFSRHRQDTPQIFHNNINTH